jgi:hypothetical protein
MSKANLGRMRKNVIVAVLLLFMPLLFTDVTAKEKKHGAQLSIQKKDSQEVRGELLTVKGSHLLLMDSSSLSGVTLDIGEISRIRVVKKSKFFKGLGYGSLLGVGIGAMLGLAQGDDEPGFMSWKAGDYALILGLAGGVLGGSVGGIFGYSAGIDELIDLEGRSNDEIMLILNKLKSGSRYPEALPENIKIESSALHKSIPKSIEGIGPAQSPISLNIDFASKKQKRGFSRFHLSLEPGIFRSQGSTSLIKAFRGWGFGDSKHDWEYTGWFFSGDYVPICTSYPEGVTRRSSVLKNIKLEFSLDQKIALGFSYSPLPKSCVNGFKCFETYMDDWAGFRADNGLDLHGEFKGSVYYFSVTFMPIPDPYLQKSSIKIGAGLGLSDIHYVVSTGEEKKSYSKSSPSLMTFAEYHFWFSRGLTLGCYVDYKYVPCRVGFQLDRDWKGERMHLDFPKKNVDFGGFGFGLVLGLHL